MTGKYGINQINKKFGYNRQLLCSYSLKFLKDNNSSNLDYLNNKEFKINTEPYLELFE